MEKTVLLTGFEPFHRDAINPAWEAVKALAVWRASGFVVEARRLPCAFGAADRALTKAIDALTPAVIIAVGQAGGEADLSIEEVAVNVDDAPIPDNAQQQVLKQPIAPDGPARYFSTLPVKAIVRALHANRVPASVSRSAGTFVCNHVFYRLMHHLATRAMPARAGFIHIPYLPEQTAARCGAACMALADIVKGLRIAVQVALAAGDVLI